MNTPLRLLVGIVGLLAVIALVGIIALAFNAHPIPDVLQNVCIGSLTGLLGLLVPTKASQS